MEKRGSRIIDNPFYFFFDVVRCVLRRIIVVGLYIISTYKSHKPRKISICRQKQFLSSKQAS